MPKSRFFQHISSIFDRRILFSKIGLCHILGIAILHQCAKFHEKSTAREIQEIPFYRRKSTVPVIFRKFWHQKSVLMTIETSLMVVIVINNVFVSKNNEIRRKNLNKICKNGDFRHISGIFGRKKIFLKNRTQSCFEHC